MEQCWENGMIGLSMQKGVSMSFAGFIKVSREVSQGWLFPYHNRHERIILLSKQRNEFVYRSE